MKMNKKRALRQLKMAIEQIANLHSLSVEFDQFTRWERDTRVLLEHIFGDSSSQVEEFKAVAYTPAIFYGPTFEQSCIEAYANGLRNFKSLLESMLNDIDLYDEETISLKVSDDNDFWIIVHPKIREVAQSRYESQHFADSVEAALKQLNIEIKQLVKQQTGKELDGSGLMTTAFSLNNPILKLGDISTETGRNIQQGYMKIFEGSMMGIRNPKAHNNLVIDSTRAIHLIFLASLLMYKVDEAC